MNNDHAWWIISDDESSAMCHTVDFMTKSYKSCTGQILHVYNFFETGETTHTMLWMLLHWLYHTRVQKRTVQFIQHKSFGWIEYGHHPPHVSNRHTTHYLSYPCGTDGTNYAPGSRKCTLRVWVQIFWNFSQAYSSLVHLGALYSMVLIVGVGWVLWVGCCVSMEPTCCVSMEPNLLRQHGAKLWLISILYGGYP